MSFSPVLRHVLVSCVVGLGIAVFAACSSSSDGSSGSSGTGVTDAAPGNDAVTPVDAAADTSSATDSGVDSAVVACVPPADAGAACNAIAQTATDVSIMPSGTAIPTGTGGTIVEGRYHTTAITSYTGSTVTGVTLKQTWEFCQGGRSLVGDEPGKPQYRKSGPYTIAGNQLTSPDACTTQSPNTTVPFDSFTANATTLTFYSSSLLFSVTLTKQ
jgi:hypothetical protein